MSVIVSDKGFASDDWVGPIADLENSENAVAVDLASHDDPTALQERLNSIQLIRVDFPSFADGRGFTIARHLRLLGYTGRLRAKGHVISDQYAMARRSGFDEVEISDELASRQPEGEWNFRADWQANDYQNRLRTG